MSLSREQLEEYREDGFLLVPDLFRPAELAPVIAELDELVDGIAAILHERGHIADTHADKGFTTRLAALNRDFPGAGVLANLRGKFGPALAELWRSHQLLDIVEQLIGRDIDGHANWVLRSKTPETSRLTVPWHQDAAYFTPDAEATFIPTIWIPLVDATRRTARYSSCAAPTTRPGSTTTTSRARPRRTAIPGISSWMGRTSRPRRS